MSTALAAHAVVLLEPRRGYRFGPESPALCDFCVPGARVLDLGAGCGVIGLSLRDRFANRVEKLVLVELDPTLHACSVANSRGLDNVLVQRVDLRELPGDEKFDTIVANPPFFDPGAGVESSTASTRGATHRHAGGPAEFVVAASHCLAPRGRIWVLHPAGQLHEVMAAAATAGLCVTTVVLLHARHTGRPYRVWVELSADAEPLRLIEACVATAR